MHVRQGKLSECSAKASKDIRSAAQDSAAPSSCATKTRAWPFTAAVSGAAPEGVPPTPILSETDELGAQAIAEGEQPQGATWVTLTARRE